MIIKSGTFKEKWVDAAMQKTAYYYYC